MNRGLTVRFVLHMPEGRPIITSHVIPPRWGRERGIPEAEVVAMTLASLSRIAARSGKLVPR